MSVKILASLALALSLVVASPSQATLVTYDFSGSSSGLGTGNLGISSATITSGGLDVVVSAIDEFGAAGELARNNGTGLGVVGEPGTGLETNQVGADANGGEALEFDFSPNSVAIVESVVFETGMEAGSLDVLINNVLLESISWTPADGTTGPGDSEITHVFTSPLVSRTAQAFTFRAVEDSFRVKTLTVDTVPEPTGLLLSVVGLLGLVTRSRQRTN